MKTTVLATSSLLALCFHYSTNAQDTRAFNQNASRSNHTRLGLMNDPWVIGFNAGASFATKSDQNTLFRGNSMATKFFANYYFDKVGIGLSSGIIPGTISDDALNSFITERKYPADQIKINTSNPFNTYLLAGPSFRFGNRVIFNAALQGGMFFNDPGSVSIQQQTATNNRLLYSFQAAEQKLYPGFSGSINIAYPINRSTQFIINTDYLQSHSSVRVLDINGGIDVPVQQNRYLKLLTAGIGIIKTFGGRNANHANRANNTNGASYANNATETNYVNATTTSCGPVTQRTTNADGTVDELTFACPEDALAYTNRISMNVTTPKQTQGATFGEKVNQGLHAAGSVVAQGKSTFGEKVNAGLHAAGGALAQGASLYTISGNLGWLNTDNNGITTNKSVSTKSTLAGGAGGGAAQASYARTTPATSFGTLVRFQARETGSGRPSGRRDKGSGMATGRRQYEPVFSDDNGTLCGSCLANVKSNPLYQGNSNSGVNPMHNAKSITGANGEDGIGDMDVALVDLSSGTVIAKTKTESNGDFYFANVPEGNYGVKVYGRVTTLKGYDITTTTATDLSGTVSLATPPIQLYMQVQEGTNQSDSVYMAGKKMIPVTVPDITGSKRVGPIKGVIVKGSRNADEVVTNENGEFEFTNLEAGKHSFTMEQTLFILDETVLTLQNRAQDHNSSRSNKSASVSAGADPQGVQDHNSSRSNK